MNLAIATKIFFASIFLLLFMGTASAAAMTTASRTTNCVAPCAVFFDAVNFLLIISAPEIRIDGAPRRLVCLAALDEQIIFPQLPNIIAQSQGIEILNQAITYPIIVEVNPGVLGYFLTQISRKAANLENNKDFFQ